MTFTGVIEAAGVGLDLAGVAVVVIGAIFSAGASAFGPRSSRGYVAFRQNLGRTILLGLELLVAADIVRTVAVKPSMDDVLVLGIIVAIRTVLSFSLEVELEGRWPWQRASGESRTRIQP